MELSERVLLAKVKHYYTLAAVLLVTDQDRTSQQQLRKTWLLGHRRLIRFGVRAWYKQSVMTRAHKLADPKTVHRVVCHRATLWTLPTTNGKRACVSRRLHCHSDAGIAGAMVTSAFQFQHDGFGYCLVRPPARETLLEQQTIPDATIADKLTIKTFLAFWPYDDFSPAEMPWFWTMVRHLAMWEVTPVTLGYYGKTQTRIDEDREIIVTFYKTPKEACSRVVC